jgi:DNA polymerase-3 subunit alpha
VHAAGVVIADQPLADLIPVMLNKEGAMTTQFPMGQIEALGFMKMDFLGLRTLSVIQQSVEMIKVKYGIDIDISNIPDDDMKVYDNIGEGKTVGIFQLESPGMTRFMKDLKPSSLEDIIAGISLFRPGPMDQIPRYVEGRHNPEKITYLHPLLKPILDVTYGCLVYQEQVMQTVRDLGGFSMGRSDLVRKAMSKKQVSVMEKERKNFIYGITGQNGEIEAEGALRRGVPENIANILFDQMMDFASYAFNKAHAAAYAVVAYRTAWLKTHYPEELMAATMNSYTSEISKLSFYINECRSMGIDVLPPDINESYSGFTVTQKAIRFGLVAVKNTGEAAVNSIISERTEGGKFESFPDFCMRTVGNGVNKKSIESLIKCGAFDSFGIERSRMLAVLETLTDSIAYSRERTSASQISLMDLYEGQIEGLDRKKIDVVYPTLDEFPKDMLCSFEKDLLGVYITGHPVSEHAEILKHKTNLNSRDISEWVAVNMMSAVEGEQSGDETFISAANPLESANPIAVRELRDGAEVLIGGMISGRKNRTTKTNKMMATFIVEDIYGQIEVMLFPGAYEKCSALLQPGAITIVRGKLMIRLDEVPKVACDEILPLGIVKNDKTTLKISLPQGAADPQISWLLPFISYFQGNTKVCIINLSDSSEFYLDERYRIDAESDLIITEMGRRLEDAGGKVAFA